MRRAIIDVSALEILDSRGNPTLEVRVELAHGVGASASVPSGASTSQSEALELRDGDRGRYGGLGVRRAVDNIDRVIRPVLIGRDPTDQVAIDRELIALDGTPNKSHLGANAILGASMAVARAGAVVNGMPLYRYLSTSTPVRIPVPLMNVINGGKHATNRLEFQEFMIVPHGAPTFAEALRWGAETFHALKTRLGRDGYTTGVGDEGGFAPDLEDNEEACALVVQAITDAGYVPGEHISIALDPAASSFYRGGRYSFAGTGGGAKDAEALLALYQNWIHRYPIVLIEDGFAETDWRGFKDQTERMGRRIMVVGDDIYATNPALIRRGIANQTTNAALIKLNQIGTVTETIEAIALCQVAGWHYVISHRSGETIDPFIADFAVAMAGGLIKAGSLSRGERLAKYNRLLRIEHELGKAAKFVDPFRALERT